MENCCLAVRAQANIFTGQTTDKSRRRRHFAMCKNFVFFLAFSIMDDFRELELVVTSAPPPKRNTKATEQPPPPTRKKTCFSVFCGSVFLSFVSEICWSATYPRRYSFLCRLLYTCIQTCREGERRTAHCPAFFFYFIFQQCCVIAQYQRRKKKKLTALIIGPPQWRVANSP